jgi:hypothetical protein
MILGLALALHAMSAVAAEDEKPWSMDASVGNEFVGGDRPTGGLSVVLGARRTWRINERFSWHTGLTGEAFGFAGGSHWMGLFAGPSAGVGYATPVEGLAVGLSATIPYGRVPACTGWGLCMRFWGIFPGGSLRIAYGGATIGAIADLDVRLVDTLVWTGASVGFRAGGMFSW